MKCVFRISEAGAIAIHAAACLAAAPNRQSKASEVAASLGVSEAHLVKVLQQLARSGICVAMRGPNGGFSLARDAAKISLLEVFEAIEGPLSEKSCVFNQPKCGRSTCILGDMLQRITNIAQRRLSKTTLAKASSLLRVKKTDSTK